VRATAKSKDQTGNVTDVEHLRQEPVSDWVRRR
jgi:hypothetical protein